MAPWAEPGVRTRPRLPGVVPLAAPRLRGKEIDKLHHDAKSDDAKRALLGVLPALKNMTLTVVDGDFPRDVISQDNLSFSEFVKDGLDASSFAKPTKLKGTKPAPVPPAAPTPEPGSSEKKKSKSKAPEPPARKPGRSFFLRGPMFGLVGLLALSWAGLRPRKED